MASESETAPEKTASCPPSECGTKPACKGCSHNPNGAKKVQEKKPLPHAIRKVIAVLSGKGGVGKSTVTALLAAQMQRMGLTVGVLDADITGPSMPKMFGISGQPLSNGENMLPVCTPSGIGVMSVNLLLQDPAAPVVWRGPVISGVVSQFWTDVCWGDLDVLLIDMPPGTGDVPLTVFQTIPVDDAVIVTTPQQLVGMIVEKAVRMAEMMHVHVAGIVENMSYLACPGCGEKISLFSSQPFQPRREIAGHPVLATLPLVPAVAEKCDQGRAEEASEPEIAALAALLAPEKRIRKL